MCFELPCAREKRASVIVNVPLGLVLAILSPLPGATLASARAVGPGGGLFAATPCRSLVVSRTAASSRLPPAAHRAPSALTVSQNVCHVFVIVRPPPLPCFDVFLQKESLRHVLVAKRLARERNLKEPRMLPACLSREVGGGGRRHGAVCQHRRPATTTRHAAPVRFVDDMQQRIDADRPLDGLGVDVDRKAALRQDVQQHVHKQRVLEGSILDADEHTACHGMPPDRPHKVGPDKVDGRAVARHAAPRRAALRCVADRESDAPGARWRDACGARGETHRKSSPLLNW